MVDLFKEYWEIIAGIVTFATGTVLAILHMVSRMQVLKTQRRIDDFVVRLKELELLDKEGKVKRLQEDQLCEAQQLKIDAPPFTITTTQKAMWILHQYRSLIFSIDCG